jgi:hypothetical protein
MSNADIGIITELGEDYIVVKDKKTNKLVKIVQQELMLPDLGTKKAPGTFTQLPCHPAFAITITKSQGLTIEGPVCVHGYSETSNGKFIPITAVNALTVGPSRATHSNNLYFYNDAEHSPKFFLRLLTQSFKVNKKAVSWYESLNK